MTGEAVGERKKGRRQDDAEALTYRLAFNKYSQANGCGYNFS